ncbi:MAG: hypothetical protein PHI06_02290 [Desulfobulbaceae bacterium]|nr:hypothetical protein [Desulfobulbaceae bacterium]
MIDMFLTYRRRAYVTLWFLLGATLFFANHPAMAAYNSTAHGSATNGVKRSSAGITDYAIANCAHCHEQHASVGGTEPAPDNSGPSSYAAFASEEALCLGCHGGTPNYSANGSPDNINSLLNTSYGHYPADFSAKHKAKEVQADINSNAHVECTDCHNPHLSGATKHSKGTNAVTSTSPLYGAQGTTATYNSGSWLSSSVSYSALSAAGTEYKICFKCHSGAVGTPETWRGASGTTTWTDVAKEFNPANKSYHPVVQTLAGGTGSSALTNSQLSATWQNAGSKTMYCSDCHGDDNSNTVAKPYGPHGSANNRMLRNDSSFDLWPYNPSGNPWDLKDLGSNTNSWTTRLLCKKCHPLTTDPTDRTQIINYPHRFHADRAVSKTENYPCLLCHLSITHGSGQSRMTGNYTDPSPYSMTLIGTFTIGRSGSSNVETNPKMPWLTAFTKNASPLASGGYTRGSCSVYNGASPDNYNSINCGGNHP